MEELLPLLIFIIWIAYSFYSRGQKKRNSQKKSSEASPSNQRKEPSILEQILMGQEIKVPEPEPYYEEFEDEPIYTEEAELNKKQTDWKERKAFLSAELSKITEEGQQAFGDRSEKQEQEIVALYNEKKTHVFEEDFDLKKAIIYEAVLNPPYIDFK